jgi:hypothetical protein
VIGVTVARQRGLPRAIRIDRDEVPGGDVDDSAVAARERGLGRRSDKERCDRKDSQYTKHFHRDPPPLVEEP